MFTKLQMKLAARKLQRRKEYAALDNKITNEESAFERVLFWPFRAIGFVCRWIYDTAAAILSWIWELIVALCQIIWKWLCDINIVGLINLTLLLAIIVLFSMLIMDFVSCHRTKVVSAPAKQTKIETTVAKNSGAFTNNLAQNKISEPVHVVSAEPSKSPLLRAHRDGKIYGDIIIESHGEAIVLKNNAHIRGNLYLQHMRKYVLPCGVKIEGNLFLRDLHMLQFCGPFTITGNIYVSPRSSFGPIPHDSRLGGQIIL